jgi:hypothetical protein
MWWDVVIFGRPSRNIGPDYMHRYYLIPHNKICNIYLHCFHRSDIDRALHDHPWDSVAFLLSGELSEWYHPDDDAEFKHDQSEFSFRNIRRWRPVHRTAKHTHRIVLKSERAWTLFITGRWKRKWGFFTEKGWVYKEDFFKMIGYVE